MGNNKLRMKFAAAALFALTAQATRSAPAQKWDDYCYYDYDGFYWCYDSWYGWYEDSGANKGMWEDTYDYWEDFTYDTYDYWFAQEAAAKIYDWDDYCYYDYFTDYYWCYDTWYGWYEGSDSAKWYYYDDYYYWDDYYYYDSWYYWQNEDSAKYHYDTWTLD